MFTGLIEATAKVLSYENGRLALERPKNFDDVKLGSSISVSGVCLSVIEFDPVSLQFDVVKTTDQKSRLGSLKKGEMVNLERAMRADGRFEGHVVLGHCEGVASIKDVKDNMLTVELPSDLQNLVVKHGCIAIDGVSLTIAELNEADVTVALVPHTMQHTTLDSLKKGDTVNIETDILSKYAHGR